MKIEELFHDIQGVSDHIYQLGWAERNAGNISVRLSAHLIPDGYNKETLIHHNYQINLNKTLVLLLSCTGSKMRLIAQQPEEYFGLLYCHGNEVKWYTNDSDIQPSSEWISHLRMHIFLDQQKPDHKIIMHSHPTELIALSHRLKDLNGLQINEILWDIMPEVKFFIPEGMGFVELFIPGSDDLALETISQLQNHSIILWKKHGCLATGKSIWECADQLDILNKAAKIYLLAY